MKSLLLALALLALACNPAPRPNLILSAPADNDLHELLTEFPRYDTPAEAIDAASEGAGVLILAGGYPETRTSIDETLFELAREKNLRLYIEYPEQIPDLTLGDVRHAEWERGVVTTDAFGPALQRHRILMIHDGRFAAADVDNSLLSMARVAGFDSAVYGIDDVETWPVLFEHPAGDILVATTQLSRFVTARYAPGDAWPHVWRYILTWLDPAAANLDLEWEPDVRPTYQADASLPEDAGRQSLIRGVEWYRNARMLIHPSWSDRYDEAADFPDRTGPQPEAELPAGDGSHGVLEGFSSRIRWDGSQAVRWWLRADCNSETAMAWALRGLITDDTTDFGVAGRLQDFVHNTSVLHQGPRNDPASSEYGLVSWNVFYNRAYYGDDNARVLLSTMATAAALDSDRWDEDMLRALLANFRTTGPDGFRSNRINGPELEERGWQSYWNTPRENFAPHYESWLWATYLWFYDKTGYAPLLDRTKRAISATMNAYPHEWQWTNGLQQERARMLLPLAWLVRVEDTDEHRAWLQQIAGDLLAHQDETGAIQEQLGSAGYGKYGPPASNDEYGTTEAPLIQDNDDPVADMLYTSNFAFLSLHEAAAATGDASLIDARNRLEDFLIRIQVQATDHPELDGAWFRAFDFDRWEYWASNADLGWGAWAVETGWTQSWIPSVIALGELEISLWEFTAGSDIGRQFETYRERMLP